MARIVFEISCSNARGSVPKNGNRRQASRFRTCSTKKAFRSETSAVFEGDIQTHHPPTSNKIRVRSY